MWKLAKVALILLGCLLTLAVLALLGANLYVQSSLSQEKLEAQLGKALRVPVKISSTTVSPWDGLTIRGIAVAQTDGPGDFLQAQEMKAHFLFWPILHRQIIVKDLVLSQPQIEWHQTEKGRWRLPEAAPTPAQTPVPENSAAPRPSAEPTFAGSPTPKPAKTPKASKAPKAERPHFSLQLQHLIVQNGSFHFFDKHGMPLAAFDEVGLDCPNPNPESGETQGTVRIGSANLQQRLFLSNIVTPLLYKKGRVILRGLKADLAGGTLDGLFRINPSVPESPFRTKVVFSGIDIHRLVAESGGAPVEFQGKLSGWVAIDGQSAHAKETLAGGGQLILSGGQVKNYSLLQTIGTALGIEELAEMNLSQAQADFRLGQKRVWLDSLLLESQNLRLLVWGRAKYTGGLDLKAQLAVNPKIQKQLPDFVIKNFHPLPNSDLMAIDFTITGNFKSPRTDLIEKAVGKQFEKTAGKALDILRGFLGGGKGN